MNDSTKLILILTLALATPLISANEFSDNFNSGSASRDLWQFDQKGACEIDVVPRSGPGADNNNAVRFRAGAKARCELVPKVHRGMLGHFAREPFKVDRWYGFKVNLAGPWQTHIKNEVIAQWHSTRDKYFGDTNGRGPPLAIRIIDGYFRISYGWDRRIRSTEKYLAKYTLWYGPLSTDQWVDWLFHVRWSYDEDGLIQIWKDGKMIVDHAGPNTYNDIRGNYLKLGSYHPPISRTIFLDDVYIGGHDPRLSRPRTLEPQN